MSLMIKQFVMPPLKNNNYLVADDETKEAILIDCSAPNDEMMSWANELGLKIKYILLTHGHFDHVLGVNYYKEKYGIAAYLYEKDLPLLKRINDYVKLLNLPQTDIPKVHSFNLDASFYIGQYEIKILSTPGHTMGGVCYLIDGNLFSGDTLFHGTCGRTDLPESDEKVMQESLKKLLTLPDNTPVYSGHGASTTIGHERWLY